MGIELAETDEGHGDAGNPRLWLEGLAEYVARGGLAFLLTMPNLRRTILQRMAEAGLGDYRTKAPEVQDAAISAAIETALFFMR